MKKLEIIEVNNYEYYLKDENNNYYNFNIEFQNIDKQPNKGNYIYISDELLDINYKEYSNSYTFGPLDSKYGRNIKDNDIDIIRLNLKEETLYLKRLYG